MVGLCADPMKFKGYRNLGFDLLLTEKDDSVSKAVPNHAQAQILVALKAAR